MNCTNPAASNCCRSASACRITSMRWSIQLTAMPPMLCSPQSPTFLPGRSVTSPTCHPTRRSPAGVPCPPARAALATGVPRKTWRDVRQAHARSECLGPVRIEAADPATVDAAFEDLFRLHEKRWRGRGGAGVLADAAVRAFHREAARAFCEAGMLRLYRLWIAGAVVGVYYGFHCTRKAYGYL